MSEAYRYDAAILGGGIAGLMAGARLAELGSRVCVMEQGEQERYPCNTRFTGGAFHVCFHDVDADEGVLVDSISQRTLGFASAELARAVAQDARVAVQWLKAKGIKFIKGGVEAWRAHTLAPPLLVRPGLHWEGRGGDVMLRMLGGALKESGSPLLLGARGVRLHRDEGRCAGLEMEHQGKRSLVPADNVVLCDGGFQANHALLREFVTSAPEKLKQRGAGTGNGDGVQMAREVGARLVGMDKIYGHLLCRDAMHSDALWPFPMLDFVCAAGIVVDGAGRRFTDEGLGGVHVTNCVARLPDPLSSTVVFDEAIWSGPARDFILPANPHLVSAGGTILKAAELSGLSRQIGLPAGALEATVTQYNAAIENGTTRDLDPPRSTSTYKAYPIRQQPFYAVRLCAGITFTMGGMAIDGAARVLDEQNRPVPGLYAAGCTTGGLEGGTHAGYVGGLAKSAVMALRAAEHIASRGRSQDR